METTDTPSGQAGRPRPWLLIALAVVAVLFVASRFWPGSPATAPAGPSNARPGAAVPNDVKVDPEQLDVRLEALGASDAENQEGGRNPFRFKPPPPPPPPPPQEPQPTAPAREVTRQPTGPPPPPPIPLKFIGIVEVTPGDRVAAFSDCKSTMHAREGQVLLGQYRLVRLGIESVVMEYLNGRGTPQTIRMSGQECVGK